MCKLLFFSPHVMPIWTFIVFISLHFYICLFHHVCVRLCNVLCEFCHLSFSVPPTLLVLLNLPSPLLLFSSHPGSKHGDEGNLGLVILLVLFSVVILTTIFSLIFVVW